MSETPADVLRRAASLMRERAEAASPGPWHQMCMGSEGCQVINDGHLRERKHVSFSGRKEWKADHADAEHIASWHPLAAIAVAPLLENRAAEYDDLASDGYGVTGAWFVAGEDGGEPDPFIALARIYLGEQT